MASWQQRMNERIGKFADQVNELEQQKSIMLDALTDISVGLVSTGDPDSWSHATKLQLKAARTLKKVAERAKR